MSLINDALKRATNAQPSPGSTPPAEPNKPMRPVDGHPSAGLPRYFFPILIFVFSGAFWFLIRGWEARRQAELYPEPIVVQARESTSNPTTPGEPTASMQITVHEPAPITRNFSVNDEPVPTPATGAPAATTTIPSPVEPTFRLQGIFFRPAKPSAVVNTKTVFIGDTVSGARVRAIDRQSVTLEKDGQTQVLTLQ